MDYNADPLEGKKEYLTMNQPYVESRPQRPVGVSILAILSLIAALFCVLNVFSYEPVREIKHDCLEWYLLPKNQGFFGGKIPFQ